jgi:thymidylate synthase
MRFDLQAGFPLVTTKKVHLRSIIQELLWFLTGSSNNNWLKERGASPFGMNGQKKMAIWVLFMECSGAVGLLPDGEHIDQIAQAHSNPQRPIPTRRRIIVSAWNVADLSKMALDALPCFFSVLRLA